MSLSRRDFIRSGALAGAVLLLPGTSWAGPTSGRTVRYRLTASASTHRIAGRTVDTWTYDGSLPGPLLRAQVGDRVVVDVVNDLPEPTTVHWHGVELPATEDGSSISQAPIAPGATHRYEFVALAPSLHWYHPHVDTNVQVERGLYGGFLIEEPGQTRRLGVLPQDEHVLLLDDVLLDEDGIAPPFPHDPLENAVVHFNGRRGDVLLVNGEQRPRLRTRNGTPVRLRVVNVANSRFMRLSFGEGQAVWLVGGDGGLIESPVLVEPIGMVEPGDHGGGGHGGGMHGGMDGDMDGDMNGGMHGGMVSDPDLSKGIMLTPGERADIVWVPTGARGEVLTVETHDWPRGDHSASYGPDGSIVIGHDPMDGARPPVPLFDVELLGQPDPAAGSYAPPTRLRTIEPIPTDGAPITVTMGHGPPDASGDVTFFMQRGPGGPMPFPALTPEDVETVRPGEVRLIEVTNLTMGAHNFHLHGFFFQHVETEYVDMDAPENNRVVPAERLENKDSILVPGRPGAGMRSRSIVRLAVRFDDTGRVGGIEAYGKDPTADRSGGWLMHCHLLEHSDSGMLSFVQVRDDD